MLKKIHRLTTKEVKRVLGRNRQFATAFFLVKFLVNRQKFSRFSILVSAKLDNRATQRNLIRRRAYEAIRRNWDKLNSTTDAILIAKRQIIGISYAEIEKDILNLFDKLEKETGRKSEISNSYFQFPMKFKITKFKW